MILTIHLLTGAALGQKIHPFGLALILAFFSHYALDFLPHSHEYSVKRIKEKKWHSAGFDFLKVGLDLIIGLTIIFLIIGLKLAVYETAFLAILADGLTFLSLICDNHLLRLHEAFHRRVHFLRKWPIPSGVKFFIELTVLVVAIYFLAD